MIKVEDLSRGCGCKNKPKPKPAANTANTSK